MSGASKVGSKPVVIPATQAVKPKPKVEKPLPLAEQAKNACADAASANPVSYAERKVQYVDEQLMKSCSDLQSAKTPQEKVKVEEKIKALQTKKQEQKKTATFKELNDGRLRMTLSKDVTVKNLQERFDLQDGTLRENPDLTLSYEYRDYP